MKERGRAKSDGEPHKSRLHCVVGLSLSLSLLFALLSFLFSFLLSAPQTQFPLPLRENTGWTSMNFIFYEVTFSASFCVAHSVKYYASFLPPCAKKWVMGPRKRGRRMKRWSWGGKASLSIRLFCDTHPPNWITLKGRVRPTSIFEMGEIAARSVFVERLREYHRSLQIATSSPHGGTWGARFTKVLIIGVPIPMVWIVLPVFPIKATNSSRIGFCGRFLREGTWGTKEKRINCRIGKAISNQDCGC